ncbi:uncharacterized protein LOC124156414 isoform X2 [Ischnura elegans]|uniref:uncharacterized protein LOC124156414 isoform X2 n=1 Tax=Ischnura elegans TaxID=197161 RepID=UPI001ED86F02|nr:uncharacterized protein LOC124156414 isoform X2 [Ischnura elegans]
MQEKMEVEWPTSEKFSALVGKAKVLEEAERWPISRECRCVADFLGQAWNHWATHFFYRVVLSEPSAQAPVPLRTATIFFDVTASNVHPKKIVQPRALVMGERVPARHIGARWPLPAWFGPSAQDAGAERASKGPALESKEEEGGAATR